MRLPRDLSGIALAQALSRLGYSTDSQTGSHMRLTTRQPHEHHITIPRHDPLRLGTLAAILDAVAAHHQMSRSELLGRLFD